MARSARPAARTSRLMVALALGPLVASCGGGSHPASAPTTALNGEQTKTPTQVLADAKAALLAAKSVHVTGGVTQTGSKQALDVRLQGADAEGHVASGTVALDFVHAAGKDYLKAPVSFWTSAAGATAAKRLAGKWVEVDGRQIAGLAGLTLQGLASSITTNRQLKPGVTTAVVDGRPAVLVTATSGSTLAVSGVGPPVVLQESGGPGAQGALTFSDYGTPQTITAPPGAIPYSTKG